jgi:hypothetical protein
MRTLISAAVLLAFADAGIAAQDLTDTAHVISSTPIVERHQRAAPGMLAGVRTGPTQERGWRELSWAV